MATLLNHDDLDASVCHRVRQIVRKYECDEAESASARALLAQIEARDPEPQPNEWILIGAIALFTVILVVVGTLAWMGL